MLQPLGMSRDSDARPLGSASKLLADLSDAERSALRLDGHIVPLGVGFTTAGRTDTWWQRLESCVGLIPRRAVVEGLSAAWVWGAIEVPPGQLQFCIDRRFRSTQPLSGSHQMRYRRFDDSETIRLPDIAVTTASRTAADLSRTFASSGEEWHQRCLDELVQIGPVLIPR